MCAPDLSAPDFKRSLVASFLVVYGCGAWVILRCVGRIDTMSLNDNV